MISFKRVLAAVFPTVYEYDEHYDELYGRCKPNILEQPFPLRKMFYDYYDPTMDENKQLSARDIDQFMDNDNELLFVRNPSEPTVVYHNDNTVYHTVYKHLIEQDYKYLNAKPIERNHMDMKHIVWYEQFGDYNVNNFLSNRLWPKHEEFDSKLLSLVINYDNIFVYYNEYNGQKLFVDTIIDRYLDDQTKLFAFCKHLQSSQLQTTYYLTWLEHQKDLLVFDWNLWKALKNFQKDIYPAIIKHYNKHLQTILKNKPRHVECMLSFADSRNRTDEWYNVMFLYEYRYCKNSLGVICIDSIIFKQYKRCCDRWKLPLQMSVVNKHATIKDVCEYIDNIGDKNILGCFDNIEELLTYIDQHKHDIIDYPKYVFIILYNLIKHSDGSFVIKQRVIDYLKDHKDVFDFRDYKHNGHTLAYHWVKFVREEPPYELYCSPMTENLASLWRQLFSVPPPEEMTNIKRWLVNMS